LDEKAKYQPRIIKKKPKLDENRIKIGERILFYIHNVDGCREFVIFYVASLALPQI
jgi:hypothetical protein